MKTIAFQISDEAFELLQKINKAGQAEYRDNRYNTVAEFLESDTFKNGHMTEFQFRDRNFDGTYHLIHELHAHDLVDTHEMAWHPTYIITKRGEEILKNAK